MGVDTTKKESQMMVNSTGEDSVSVDKVSGITDGPLMELADMHMVPGWDHGEVKRDDTTENESHNMNTNQAENIIDEEFLQARLTDKKPEGNSFKRVVGGCGEQGRR
jgi:hypothetical protein